VSYVNDGEIIVSKASYFLADYLNPFYPVNRMPFVSTRCFITVAFCEIAYAALGTVINLHPEFCIISF
jgi:hypothetical protein